MKTLLALLLLSTSALADPVLLYGPTQCSGTGYCYNLDSSIAPTDIDLYLPHQYLNSGTAVINGVSYSTAQLNCPIAVPTLNNYVRTCTAQPLTDPQGNVVYLTATLTGIHRQINAGRAHWWVTYWTFQDGQLDGYTNADPFSLIATPPPAFGGCAGVCHQ